MLQFCLEASQPYALDVSWIIEHMTIHEWSFRIWRTLGEELKFKAKLLTVYCQHYNLQIAGKGKEMYIASTKLCEPGDFIIDYYGVIAYKYFAKREQFDQKRTKLGTSDINTDPTGSLKTSRWCSSSPFFTHDEHQVCRDFQHIYHGVRVQCWFASTLHRNGRGEESKLYGAFSEFQARRWCNQVQHCQSGCNETHLSRHNPNGIYSRLHV